MHAEFCYFVSGSKRAPATALRFLDGAPEAELVQALQSAGWLPAGDPGIAGATLKPLYPPPAVSGVPHETVVFHLAAIEGRHPTPEEGAVSVWFAKLALRVYGVRVVEGSGRLHEREGG